jgi:hypothetical protein
VHAGTVTDARAPMARKDGGRVAGV